MSSSPTPSLPAAIRETSMQEQKQDLDKTENGQLESSSARDATVREVRFYRASERPFGAFSNLYRREVVFDGMIFATAEHAYQYGKPRKDRVRAWLMAAPSPSLLAMAAHGLYAWDIAPGWSGAKVERMRRVLTAKFTQHADLRALLLGTDDARLVETATTDSDVNRFWGEVNGVGRNTLGVLLMALRAELAATDSPAGAPVLAVDPATRSGADSRSTPKQSALAPIGTPPEDTTPHG